MTWNRKQKIIFVLFLFRIYDFIFLYGIVVIIKIYSCLHCLKYTADKYVSTYLHRISTH